MSGSLKVRKLTWSFRNEPDYRQEWSAETRIGRFSVVRYGCELDGWRGWHWYHSYDDIYDNNGPCKSGEEGKRFCQDVYEKRVREILEEAMP